MNKSEMLEMLISHYANGNKARFAAMLGIKAQTINSWEKRESFDHELIYSSFDDISGDWLLSGGKGEMLKNKQNANTDNEKCRERTEIALELLNIINRIVKLDN